MNRVLCVVPSWLGDALLALPALEMLSDAGLELVLLARPSVVRVVESLAGGHRIVVASGARAARLRTAWRLRRRERLAAAVILAPSFSAALAGWASGARLRIGERGPGRFGLLTHALAPAGRDTHLALAHQRLAQAVLAALGKPLPKPRSRQNGLHGLPVGLYDAPHIAPGAAETEAVHRLLAAHSVQPGYFVIAPGARYGSAKRYPETRFAEAARSIMAATGWRPVVVGTAGDYSAVTALCAALPEAVDLSQRTALGELVALVAMSRGALSNDSGTMHLAAAVGVPVVGVFGSTNPMWTRPLGPRAKFVHHLVPCGPCYARTCTTNFACMLEQRPEAVAAALLEACGSRSARSPAGRV